MRHLRFYRVLRVALVIAAAALRYWWLQRRERWGGRLTPSQAAWDRAHGRTGRAIYRLATHLGGGLVKVGQVLGARGDVLPQAFVAPLRGLHDRVPARPLRELEAYVARELGTPLAEVFAEVEPEPLAAASLAQVHGARLRDGTRVVIKIQYPEARRLFPTDLGSLRRAVRVARRLNRELDLRALADELAEFVTLELDFKREARSTERAREALAGDSQIVVPQLHAALCTERVLVLERLAGTPLSAADQLRERGVDLRDLARRVAGLYARMIFEHGFFHGDPHPGNIFVLDDGRLGLVDFGLAKELPPGFATNAATMIAAAMAQDVPRALAAAREIGFVIADERGPELITLVRALLGDYSQAKDMIKHVRVGELEIPSHFTLVVRVMIILSGLSHALVPGERLIGSAIGAVLAPHLVRATTASRSAG